MARAEIDAIGAEGVLAEYGPAETPQPTCQANPISVHYVAGYWLDVDTSVT